MIVGGLRILFVVGGVLLSHILPGAVPSAWVGLASGFGMGPGVSQPLSPPTRLFRACSLLGFWCTRMFVRVWCV